MTTTLADLPTVLAEDAAPGVRLLTLNRPERLNAMDHQLVSELHQRLDEVAGDPDVRCVVITGAGRGFCAGLDLKGSASVPGTEEQGRAQRGLATQQHIATLIPEEWIAPSAMGSPAQCVAAVRNQLDLGCDGVILHGATPAELAPIVAAY